MHTTPQFNPDAQTQAQDEWRIRQKQEGVAPSFKRSVGSHSIARKMEWNKSRCAKNKQGGLDVTQAMFMAVRDFEARP